MTRKTKAAKPLAKAQDNGLRVQAVAGKSEKRNLADVSLDPAANAMVAARMYNKFSFGEQDTTALFQSLHDTGIEAASGDLTHQKSMLAVQADVLNTVFAELSRRAAMNMGEYLGATETYLRLALKAQSQCRSTIEALDRLCNDRTQTVRHVHVNQGGQAVIADQVHNHAGGKRNGNSIEQPHAPESAAAGQRAPLSGANPIGEGLPVTSR